MAPKLQIAIDRTARATLTEQVRTGVLTAIAAGALSPGARLPSWLALAEQLGVARGTVKAAYERLADEQVIVASSHGGTRVAHHLDFPEKPVSQTDAEAPPEFYQHLLGGAAPFQMGVPAPDGFPVSLLARLRAHAARTEVNSPALYPDPRGAIELRREIAAHVALARGISCRPSQIYITAGFAGALGTALGVLRAEGREAWVENPGFFQSRRALELAGLTPVPVPVDSEGIDVAHGIAGAPGAALALVTPGQHAPLGITLSLRRRVALLEWAARTGAWILEDDYLGELQLERRAAPALASLDRSGRVIHMGSFSKTISPALRLGFIIAPAELVPAFDEAALCFGSTPGPALQHAIAAFMRDGHYMRHLRRMKRIYSSKARALQSLLEAMGYHVRVGGLGVVVYLPDPMSDVAVVEEARARGLAPAPLSRYFSGAGRQQSGLLLGLATIADADLLMACEQLHQSIIAVGSASAAGDDA